MAVTGERPARNARLVDLSESGLLLVLGEPFCFWRGQRILLTLDLPMMESRHVLGRVARVGWGADHRTYVGVEFDEPIPEAGDPALAPEETRA